MKKKKMVLLKLLLVFVLLNSCKANNGHINASEEIHLINFNQAIKEKSEVDEVIVKGSEIGLRQLNELPKFNYKSEKPHQVDLRFTDVGALELSDRAYDLMQADFDDLTIWPENLPVDFDPKEIIELGKSRGPMIEGLHEKGINGSGVNIAIIDHPLSTEHIEYKEQIVEYTFVGEDKTAPTMHGNATASIAVGSSLGVAPKSNLYFFGIEVYSSREYADVVIDIIEEIIERNNAVDEREKIHVIAIPKGFVYEDVVNIVEEAKKSNIFVITTKMITNYNYQVNGLGREPMSDPLDIESYLPGWFWSSGKYKNSDELEIVIVDEDNTISESLYVPMDSKTVAGHKHDESYTFYRHGGLSWCVPYFAGLYALTYQVDPKITPDRFLEKAYETSDIMHVYFKGTLFYRMRIVNAKKLIDSLSTN